MEISFGLDGTFGHFCGDHRANALQIGAEYDRFFYDFQIAGPYPPTKQAFTEVAEDAALGCIFGRSQMFL